MTACIGIGTTEAMPIIQPNTFTNKLYSCRKCTYIVYVYVVISDHADLQHVPIKTSILRYLPVSVIGTYYLKAN
jgi:hypothetical protein